MKITRRMRNYSTYRDSWSWTGICHHCTNNLIDIISYSAEFTIGAEKCDTNPISSHTISIEREREREHKMYSTILRPNAHSKWRLRFDLIALVFYENTSIATWVKWCVWVWFLRCFAFLAKHANKPLMLLKSYVVLMWLILLPIEVEGG